MAEKIAASVDNAMKYQAAADSAKVDYLTGLPNARSLFHHLDVEIARCAREGSHLAAILCDLNGFKALNDRFGHLAGNKVLEAFAGKLRTVCREYDFISRMGGDEFVISQSWHEPQGGEEVCRRVNTAAAESASELCGGASLSASVGTAFFPEDALNAEQLLVEADRRMYVSKNLLRQETEPPAAPQLVGTASEAETWNIGERSQCGFCWPSVTVIAGVFSFCGTGTLRPRLRRRRTPIGCAIEQREHTVNSPAVD